MTDDYLLTIKELAARLRLSVNNVRKKVRAGLPVIKFNQRVWRFHWPTVLAYLNGN